MDYFYCGVYNDFRSILQDYLDIKFTSNLRLQNEVLSKIMESASTDDYHIELADGIHFGKTLVLVQNHKEDELRNLIILNKISKKIRYYENFNAEPILM